MRGRAFSAATRAGATSITAVLVTAGTIAAAALAIDHVWLVDQRDVLKSAAEAGSIAATLEIDRQLAANPRISDDDLKEKLQPIAASYVFVNLMHLPIERLVRARDTLEVEITDLDRARRTVGVRAKADLGGTLFSRALPLLGNYAGPERAVAHAGVESESTPIEVVIAMDISSSMARDLRYNLLPRGSSDSRMSIVKRATKHLVATLAPNGYNRTAIGIVPWSVNVRLGATAARNWARKRWARYPAKRTYPVPYMCNNCTVTPVVNTLPDPSPGAWKGCFDGHRIDAGISKVPAPTTTALFEPPSAIPFAQSYFPPGIGRAYRCPDTSERPADSSCFEHRPQDAQNNCVTQRAALFPLSTEYDAIDRAVDALAPNGGLTHSTLGVLWAQRMLEPTWKGVWGGAVHPADPEAPEHAGLRKAIVLLTDGEDSYCGNGNSDCSGTPLTLSRTEACTQAKARGTEIFVIAAMHPDKVSGALGRGLRACSSESDSEYPQGTRRPGTNYVFLNNATPSALEDAFAEVGSQLRALRKAY